MSARSALPVSVSLALLLVVAVALALSAGLRPGQDAPGTPAASAAPDAGSPPPALAAKEPAPVPEPTSEHRHVEPLAVCPARGVDPLKAARDYYEAGMFHEALSCAAQACAFDPDDPQAHSERAAALTALARFEEAKLSYARALALDPEHLDALLGAANLYVAELPSTRELDELGLVYAERGLSLSEDREETGLSREFALLTAMAFNDLGQPGDALARAEELLAADAGSKATDDARYERAVALFELCRFDDAKAAFTSLLSQEGRAAVAHHHLGLLAERNGEEEDAQRHFAEAAALAPEDFAQPVKMSKKEFEAEVKKAIERLPEDMRRDLRDVPVEADDLPLTADLLGEPPLSPTILGLFRGPPLDEGCLPEDGDPCRSVALYRLNLARAVSSREELIEQIRVTLLHEVGHLRGEDDFELAARGLE